MIELRQQQHQLPHFRYKPRFNLAPFDICPILVSSKHFDEEEDSANRTIMPALWSLIPRWHKGDYKKHGLTTNNARRETIETSKLYRPLLEKGKRCVMLIEGFYEWKTTDTKAKSSERQVYFIHMPQINSHIKMEDKSTWTNCENIRLMAVAGLFDIWYDDKGDSIYSFSVITFESSDFLGWLHERTPAILESEEAITKWLDYGRVPYEEALQVIRQPKSIVWYEVSNYVNNIRNQSEKCNKPYDRKAAKESGIMRFFKKKKENDDGDEKEESTPSKQAKLE
jgi:putative SOS response-associated peptidase YedK